MKFPTSDLVSTFDRNLVFCRAIDPIIASPIQFASCIQVQKVANITGISVNIIVDTCPINFSLCCHDLIPLFCQDENIIYNLFCLCKLLFLSVFKVFLVLNQKFGQSCYIVFVSVVSLLSVLACLFASLVGFYQYPILVSDVFILPQDIGWCEPSGNQIHISPICSHY